jgi:hypothetical protein
MIFLLNVGGGKIIIGLNAHALYSKVRSGLIKVICFILILCASEFHTKRFLLLTTKSISEKIYCDARGIYICSAILSGSYNIQFIIKSSVFKESEQ